MKNPTVESIYVPYTDEWHYEVKWKQNKNLYRCEAFSVRKKLADSVVIAVAKVLDRDFRLPPSAAEVK